MTFLILKTFGAELLESKAVHFVEERLALRPL